jgi:hypothetical protein
MWLYTFYYISVNCLFYMFRLVTSPIIRSTQNCNHNIWHWSNFGKYSVWSQLKMRGTEPSVLPSAIIRSRKVAQTGPYLSSLADFTHCIFQSLTSGRCCDYSYMCSWWWVELPPEICTESTLQKYNNLYIVVSRWTIIRIDSRCMDPWT